MLIVLAGRNDLAARQCVAHWRSRGIAAELMLSVDFTRRGMCLGSDAGEDRIAVGSRVIACSALAGVICRLPAVTADELSGLHQDDRAYAAAESHAFALAWLHKLACPVLNRPGASALVGPGWSTDESVAFAARHRVQVRTVTRRVALHQKPATSDESASSVFAVHVVGDRAFGGDARAGQIAVRFAKAAEVELLRVLFERNEAGELVLISADHWVDVSAVEIADAIAERCTS